MQPATAGAVDPWCRHALTCAVALAPATAAAQSKSDVIATASTESEGMTYLGTMPTNDLRVSLAGTTFTVDDIVLIHPGAGCAPVTGDSTKVTCTAFKDQFGKFKRFTVRACGVTTPSSIRQTAAETTTHRRPRARRCTPSASRATISSPARTPSMTSCTAAPAMTPSAAAMRPTDSSPETERTPSTAASALHAVQRRHRRLRHLRSRHGRPAPHRRAAPGTTRCGEEGGSDLLNGDKGDDVLVPSPVAPGMFGLPMSDGFEDIMNCSADHDHAYRVLADKDFVYACENVIDL